MHYEDKLEVVKGGGGGSNPLPEGHLTSEQSPVIHKALIFIHFILIMIPI